MPIAKLNPDGFVYYKVVRSEKNATPAYPDDGYIEYSSDFVFSTYTDKNPLAGKAYYRVCAIYDVNASGLKPRVCSNVLAISRSSAETPVVISPKEQKTPPLPPKPETSSVTQGKTETPPSTGISSLM
jgi:hypothetical protein